MDLMLIRFSAYGFLKNLRLFEPFFLLYFLKFGMSYVQIGLLITVREISTNILEIPSGIMADYFSKRSCMLFSFGLYIISFLTIGLSTDIRLFFLSMVFYGAGDAFRSGTHKSIIMDWLDKNNKLDQKHKYYGYTRSWSLKGSALSSLISAFLVIYFRGYSKIFLYSVIPYILCFILLWTYPKDKIKSKHSIKVHITSLFSHATSKNIRRIILNSSTFEAVFKSIKDFLQPLLKYSLSLILISSVISKNTILALCIGIFYFIIFLISSSSSKNSYKLVKKIGLNDINALNISFLLLPLLIISGAFSVYVHGLIKIPLLLISFTGLYALFNIRKPLMVAFYGDNTDKSHRAAILSVDSQVKSVILIFLSPAIGKLADMYGPSNALIIAGLLLFPITYLLRIQKK